MVNNEVALVLLFGMFGWKVAGLYLGMGLERPYLTAAREAANSRPAASRAARSAGSAGDAHKAELADFLIGKANLITRGRMGQTGKFFLPGADSIQHSFTGLLN